MNESGVRITGCIYKIFREIFLAGLPAMLLIFATSCSKDVPDEPSAKNRSDSEPESERITFSVDVAYEHTFESHVNLFSVNGDNFLPRVRADAAKTGIGSIGIIHLLDDTAKPVRTIYSPNQNTSASIQKAGDFLGVKTFISRDAITGQNIDDYYEFRVIDSQGRITWKLDKNGLPPFDKIYLSPSGDYLIGIENVQHGNPVFRDALKVRNANTGHSQPEKWSLQSISFSEDGKYVAMIKNPAVDKSSKDFFKTEDFGQSALAMQEYGKPRQDPEPWLVFYDSSGNELWSKPGIDYYCYVSPSGRYVAGGLKSLTLLDNKGNILWSKEGKEGITAFSKDERMMVEGEGMHIALVDVSSGKPLWTQTLHGLMRNFFNGVEPRRSAHFSVRHAQVAPDNSFLAAIIRAEYYVSPPCPKGSNSCPKYVVAHAESKIFIFSREGRILWHDAAAVDEKILISDDSRALTLLGNNRVKHYLVSTK